MNWFTVDSGYVAVHCNLNINYFLPPNIGDFNRPGTAGLSPPTFHLAIENETSCLLRETLIIVGQTG